MSKIKLNSGVYYDFLQPTEDMVKMEDIVHNLSKEQRFSNCLDVDWSVLQHVLFVHDITKDKGGNPQECYQALHHDDPEAYFRDIASPLKDLLRDYNKLYNLSAYVIGNKLNVNLRHLSDIVKEADLKALYIEDVMFGSCESDWHDYDEEKFKEESNVIKAKLDHICSLSRNTLIDKFMRTHDNYNDKLKHKGNVSTTV